MELDEVFPPDGYIQHLYCSICGTSLDLDFTDFRETVSQVLIEIGGLPVLRCPKCGKAHWPDFSRVSIIEMHKRAFEAGESHISVFRRKLGKDFGLTKVPFVYDADDYYLIPGLRRPWDDGFLTPVFFDRRVLLKYDIAPGCRLSFASTTYGTIEPDDKGYISFGINRHGRVLMWLGDIAKLTESEQYYLRSENIPSDHSLGSEFYDGQIECRFTDPTRERILFGMRSRFVDGCEALFGTKVAHLNEEVLDLSTSFNAPTIDTPRERRHVADTLNKIHLESLDNGSLGELVKARSLDPKGSGSLKRLQAILSAAFPTNNIVQMMSPFFVLYDLRVAYSHLSPSGSVGDVLVTVTGRLGISKDSSLIEIYDALTSQMLSSYNSLVALMPTTHRTER